MRIKWIYIIILWLISLIVVFFWVKKSIKVPPQVKVEVPYEKPVYYKDPNGVTHEQFQQVVLQKELLQHRLDSISKVLNIKSSEIESQDNIQTVTEIKYIPKPVYIAKDTSFSIRKVDTGYLDLSVYVRPDSSSIAIQLIDTLTRTQYTKHYLFGPDETHIDLQNRNKYVHIKSGNSFSIKQKKPILTIGPAIGYDPFYKHMFIGISIQYPFISIKK